jgi:thiol-disulfide isomerase/thioredoxin
MNKLNNNLKIISNPLFVIVMLLIVLIIVLAIFRSVSPFLNLGLGIDAHIGDLRGSFKIEAFNNNSNSQPMFVMYYADWCGHCKRTKPEFQKLMDNYLQRLLQVI